MPTDVSDPASIAALFDAVKQTYGRIDLSVQQCRHQHPRHPVRGVDLRAMVECRRGQPDGLVPVRAARLPHDEGAAAARRADHQQRLGLGACAAAQLHPLCRDQARADRAHPLVVARRARIQHRLRPDRHRQRRDDPQRGHRPRPAAGHRQGRGRAAHGCRARRPRRRLHGHPAARSQCPVHDRDGDQNALYRPRFQVSVLVETPGGKQAWARRSISLC